MNSSLVLNRKQFKAHSINIVVLGSTQSRRYILAFLNIIIQQLQPQISLD
jgi:hypothetical protein